jgi:hypothetical protein
MKRRTNLRLKSSAMIEPRDELKFLLGKKKKKKKST